MIGRLAYLLLLRDDPVAGYPPVSTAAHVWLRPDDPARPVTVKATAWCSNPLIVLRDDETGMILQNGMLAKTLRPGDALTIGPLTMSPV